MEMVQSLMALGESAARLAGVFIAIAIIEPILLIPVVFAYVPLWYAVRKNSADTFGFFVGLTPLERQRDYMHMLLTTRDFAKEVRAFDLGRLFQARFEELAGQHVRQLRVVARRRLRRQLLAAVGNSLLMAAAAGMLLWFYAEHRIGVAAVGALIAALLQFSGLLTAMGTSAGGIYETSLFVEDYNAFLAMKDDIAAGDGATPAAPVQPAPFRELAAEHVSFSYPGASRPAVADVSLRIGAGQVVALVGENGSGKTTLAKLLAGLYRPDSGHIRWDGADIGRFDQAAVRRLTTVVFQDFAKYHLTARENIGLGDYLRAGDTEGVRAAARLADAEEFLDRLPEGLETVLGREFLGGLDLSIGQWQRVALARAFFRDAPFIILDEPTAALDAKAELQLFERVRELFRGRSVLLISHRFATVRMADHIYVLQSGRVAEHGSHDDLMVCGGLYAELFNAQAAAFMAES
jgi:ATP-binding cassette subfamily B protein